MKLIIAFIALLLLIGGGSVALIGPANLMALISPGEEGAKPEAEPEPKVEEPEAEKAKEKKKEDKYSKYDYNDPEDRMRARSRALQDLDAQRKETMNFLTEIDSEEKKKRMRERDMQKWLDKK